MSILIFALVVIIIVAMLVYACDLIPLTAPFNNLIKLLVIIIGALVIIERAGIL